MQQQGSDDEKKPKVSERFVVVSGKVHRLSRKDTDPKGFWYDDYGTLWTIETYSKSWDDKPRCGIWPLVLSGTPMDDACQVHDFLYSSPVYQYFNTRKAADRWLKVHGKLLGVPTLGKVFRRLARIFGALAWEHDDTR